VSSAPTEVILAERDTLLDAQSEGRPLAKMQEELEKTGDDDAKDADVAPLHRKPLLRTDDVELERMDSVSAACESGWTLLMGNKGVGQDS
jgi:hypothetical protein